MRSARTIEELLRKELEHIPTPGGPIRRYDEARHWINYAREYLSASVHLRAIEGLLLLPWAQVTGQAVECSLKSYICASGSEVPFEHDLVKLLDLATGAGLTVEERDVFLLIDINHLYSTDLFSRTRYKARFPSTRWEVLGGTVPDSEFISRIVQDFCAQARTLNDSRNRDVDTQDIGSDTK